jgi:hypothetical protein
MVVGVMGIVTALAGVAATAQAQDMRAVIPFEFKAAGRTLPAGTYFVTPLPGSSTFQLRSSRGGVIFMVPGADRQETPNAPQLTFNKYGERYFLHQIRLSDSREYTLRRTVAERELVRAQAEGHGPAPTVVTIAATR